MAQNRRALDLCDPSTFKRFILHDLILGYSDGHIQSVLLNCSLGAAAGYEYDDARLARMELMYMCNDEAIHECSYTRDSWLIAYRPLRGEFYLIFLCLL